jgi:general secretion pathway protein E
MVLPLQPELDMRLSAGPDGLPALTDWLLARVAEAGASDLHLEPREGHVLLRWRRDGCLADAGVISSSLRANLIQRIKVLAGLLTYRTDIPQDGRILSPLADMRVAVYPAVLGEKIVVRFFQSHSSKTGETRQDWTLETLGLDPACSAKLAEFLARPQGMILLTGPAGSGKTTTLHAALRRIVEHSRGRRQIVTIEDPVERILDGVTHTELKPAAGIDYAAGLKALLRQDPEVIMVGEIRDGATAQVAIQAALTGHLILSTVHAPSAPEVLLRLLHLGVEPYLLASVVSAVMDQRLARRLCVCRRENSDAQARCAEPFVPAGCSVCSETGYQGRLLIAELLAIDGPVRAAVMNRAGGTELLEAASRAGWRGLWARGLEKVSAGQTTLGELRRVLVPAEEEGDTNE